MYFLAIDVVQKHTGLCVLCSKCQLDFYYYCDTYTSL